MAGGFLTSEGLAVRCKERPPSLRRSKDSPDPFQGIQPLHLLLAVSRTSQTLNEQRLSLWGPHGHLVSTLGWPRPVYGDTGSPAISPRRSHCGCEDQPACVPGEAAWLCWDRVSRLSRPTSEGACSPGAWFPGLGTVPGSHLHGLGPCPRELFTPCAQAWLGGLLGEAQGAHQLEGTRLPEGVGMWQPLSGCRDPPREGSESGGDWGRFSWKGGSRWASGEARTWRGEGKEAFGPYAAGFRGPPRSLSSWRCGNGKMLSLRWRWRKW